MDKASKNIVEGELHRLVDVYGKVACKWLCSEIGALRAYFAGHGSKAQGRHALTALTWACLATDCNEVTQKEVLLSLTVFLAATAADTHLWRCALKRLLKFWTVHPSLCDLHCSIILSLEPSLSVVCMLAALCTKLLKEQKSPSVDVQAKMLDVYCKVVLQSRTAIDMQLLGKCGSIFTWVTHESFSTQLLAPTLKCLLRNPDELIHAVSWMVSVLPIDCSRYSLDILKKSVGLFSSQPTTRDGMVGLVSSLARQTSDGQVAFDVLGQLLAELKGLKLAEQRVSVLQSVGALGLCPLSDGNRQQLSEAAVRGLQTYIRQENHVGTAGQAIIQMGYWAPTLSSKAMEDLILYLKAELAAKQSALHVSYLQVVWKLSRKEAWAERFTSELIQPLNEAQRNIN
ncbi:hypothetical protein EMCRGX_G032012 [Ephydatia muelleri]